MSILNDIIEAIKSPNQTVAGTLFSGVRGGIQNAMWPQANPSQDPLLFGPYEGEPAPMTFPSPQDTMANISGIPNMSAMPGPGGGVPGAPGAPGDPNAPLTLQDMLQQYWRKSGTVRDPLIEQLAAFLGGEGVPGMTALFEPGRQAINQQFGDARERIMSTLPTGGGLETALGELETGKAGSLVDLMGDITGQAYDKAYGISMTSPGQTFGGMGLLEQIAAQKELGQMQIDANDPSFLEGLGSLLPWLFLI